jgi:oxygen-independent coproporphyrinogen-3 oxidase
MWPYYPELLERAVPRYTSYPTAAEFGPRVGSEQLEQALQTVTDDLSLYVHVPFCEQICWYCGCNTTAANKRGRVESYLDALHNEAALMARMVAGRTNVTRVAFGGGSPNALSPTDFVRLATELVLHFGLEDPVWSIELDPRRLTASWGAVIKCVGVTHSSLGVQTFAPALQEAIGRVQPTEEIERAVTMLRGAGITSLNFDLMYGLPGQTRADLEDSLRRTVELGADRIALFGYAHVPHLIKRQKRIDGSALPDQVERFAMAAFGYDYLTAAGYQPIGFDHFALPDDPMAQAAREGRLNRNFQGFTDDGAKSLLGLGSTAISCFDHVIVQNEKNTGRYQMLLSQQRLTGALGVLRSEEDRRRGAVIEGLLCHGEARLAADLLAGVRPMLAPFQTRELIRLEGDRLILNEAGLPYARTVASLFDTYRQDSARRFSSAV